jgi:hypothetical protein
MMDVATSYPDFQELDLGDSWIEVVLRVELLFWLMTDERRTACPP